MAKAGTYPEATRFMEDAMRRVGAKTISELAERTQLTGAQDTRDFYKWYRGEHRPLVTRAWPLMLATGMLSPAGAAAEVGAVSTPNPLAALAELVGNLVTAAETFEERLHALETRLREAADASARAKPGTRRRAANRR